MNLPLLVSAMKLHSMQIENMREHCAQKACAVKKQNLAKNPEPNLKSSKAHPRKRKGSKRRAKKKPRPLKVLIADRNSSKAEDTEISNVSCKMKKKREKLNPLISTKSQSTNSYQATINSKELNNSSNAIVCSVRKLISSYSANNVSELPQNMRKSPKINPRPQTSSATNSKETSDVKMKRQSCPPPLVRPFASKNVKLRKVYYSEAQSHMLAGVPCVPPTTPFNDNLVAVEVVPCLADIKSQRAIKSKLRCLVTKRQKANEKIKERILKEERRREKEEIKSLKQQRRAEIYALNEVMTEHEKEKFMKFMKEKNYGTTTISLKV